jgi:hypothetical protein
MIDCVCVETDEAVAILAPVAETTDIRISTVLDVHRNKSRFTAPHLLSSMPGESVRRLVLSQQKKHCDSNPIKIRRTRGDPRRTRRLMEAETHARGHRWA